MPLPLVLYRGEGWEGELLKIFYCLERNTSQSQTCQESSQRQIRVENDRE